MMVDETIDDSTSTVMFKPICAHCGYVFKKIEYNANKPYYGWKLSESGFTPPYCPGCGKKISEQKQQGKRLETLESRDGDMWRTAVKYVLTTVLGLVLGAVAMKFGLK